jgi:hypothetical protein
VRNAQAFILHKRRNGIKIRTGKIALIERFQKPSREQPMLLELLRPISFFLSMLSLYPVLASAFFVPGARWEERLAMALLRVTMAACICFSSGILYSLPEPHRAGAHSQSKEALLSTLPVRMFFYSVGGMAILFLLSWWLDTYYVPLLHPGCCRQ